MDYTDRLEPYQEVEAWSTSFSGCREKTECLVGGLHLIWGAEFCDAFLYEDFQVLRCGEW